MDSNPLLPGVAQPLGRYVTRVVAPNGGPLTGAGTNTYLVGTQDLLVIDPGPDTDSHMRAILDASAGRRIRWILCTHTHEDHAPGASRLRQLTGISVAAMTPPVTDHDFKLDLDKVLAPDDIIECQGVSLRAIHTPGHASNHLCFLLDATGMLFTGDHIMQGSTVVIWPPDGNMRAYLTSLRRLLDLDIKTLAPGHGHLIHEPRAEVERLIRHRLSREQKIRQVLLAAGSGGASIEVLLPEVYDDVSKTLYRLAALSLQAHLEKLLEEGEVRLRSGQYSIA